MAEQEDVPTAQGLPLRAAPRWPPLGPDDLIVVPGWRSRSCASNGRLRPETLGWLRAHHARRRHRGQRLRRAPTRSAGPGCSTAAAAPPTTTCRTSWPAATRGRTVVRDVLYVVDDRVVTSAGIASGIDLALHLVAARHGPAAAARVAREMVVYARRNGDEQQASAMLRHRAHLSDAVHRAQDLIDARLRRAAAAGRPRRRDRASASAP